MRKHQQKQILELLKTISEAQTAGLYADCQDGAIGLGGFIEQIEGEGTQTVALLEEYCELLFRASNGEIGEKQLRRHIIKVENSVKTELKPNRIEVVFFPYQLSMWDSLESIYLAAKEDPECDAYVVPIPYYEKNPDGSLGKMHYDGNQYLESIGAVDWQSYDIEERHPDVVFTHYAYDDMTNNASVHPNFFSKRLKQHCEMLVHVPYFVVAGEKVEEYYGYLPGILYADRVIAQSEAVRQSFISHYKKYDKERGWKGQFGKAEEKFIALGSPKFDKVINAKREDFELPEDWERLISKPDGTRKKAILYNTHMFKWLNEGEQYFKKIRHVFETFRNRDDIVLWWRPHPNTELNFRTKRPDLLSEYAGVISEYIEGGWGIYDDTPDLHRALAWTDAYYGDWSSLVTMYGVTGKPVMICDTDNLPHNVPLSPSFTSITGKNAWATAMSINALFKMNIEDCTLKYVGSVPGEALSDTTIFRATLYRSSVEYYGKIYFAPYFAKEIAVYSIEDALFEKIPFKHNFGRLETDKAFFGIVAYDKDIIFTPYQYPAIIRLNTETNEISYFSDWVNPLLERMDDHSGALFLSPISVGTSILLAACGTNAVLEFDMDTCKTVIHEVGEKEYRYGGICFDGENYWLSPRHDTPVVKWNPKKGVIKEFTEIFSGNDVSKWVFLSVYYNSGYAWFLPGTANYAYKIDVSSDVITVVDNLSVDRNASKEEQLNNKYFFAQNIRDCIYAYNIYRNKLTVFNCATEERKDKYFCCSSEIINRLSPLISQQLLSEKAPETSRDCRYSESAVPLVSFIDYVILESDTIEGTQKANHRRNLLFAAFANKERKSGQTIYEYIKDSV